MQTSPTNTHIAIIGAGMAGITLARALTPVAKVTLFEKSRGIGGRLSTRYHEQFEWDHGCQFMHAHRPAFQQLLASCAQAGVVQAWQAKFVEITDRKPSAIRQWSDKIPHYVGVPRMNQLAKYLSQALSIHRQTRVATITETDKGWQLSNDQQQLLGTFDWVISTAPAAQTHTLFQELKLPWPSLDKVPLLGCYALMLGYNDATAPSFDAAVVKGENISWLANNSSKPQRPQTGLSLLAHATNRWAEAHMADDISDVQQTLLTTVTQLLGETYGSPDWIDCHRWRYANIADQDTQGFLIAPQQQLAACGDWCIKGRVEAAFDSAQQLAEVLLARLGS